MLFYICPLAASEYKGSVEQTQQRPDGLQKPKALTVWLFIEKVADTYNGILNNSQKAELLCAAPEL